jgi:hypothetical protein
MVVVVAAIAAGTALIVQTIEKPIAEAPIPQPDYRLLLAQSEKHGAVVEIARTGRVAAMNQAVRAICPPAAYCLVKFILPEEREKMKSASIELVSTFAKPLAVWTRDGFSFWDCEKLGAAAAPRTAHCDPGMTEAFEALRKIENYTGWAKFCGWPPRYERELAEVLAFAASRGDGVEFRAYLRDTAGPPQND